MRAGALWAALLLLGGPAPLLSSTTPPTTANGSEPFVPTEDWQPILPGQAIPKGLHVRINLETGVKEAKLLNPEENNKKSLSVVADEDAILTLNHTVSNKTDNNNATEIPPGIEEALKNLANSKVDSKGKVFKSLDEIKSEFKDMNMDIKSDMEIMQDLFYRYRRLTKIPPYVKPPQKNKLDPDPVDSKNAMDVLDILIDLEYLTHQIDNANEFVRLKGFETIIYPLLNGTDNTLKSEALKVMSASLQNNINVQIYALETNASEMLLKILSLDNNEHIKNRAIRALGCLVRGFPAAQKQITTKHGLDIFQKILMSSNSNHFNLKVAILVLLDDLSLEHKLVTDYHLSKPEDLEKIRLYQEVNLTQKLSNPIFCDILSKFLQEYFEYNLTDLDYVHKIIPSMTTFAHICKNYHYKDKKLLKTFHKMQTVYKKNMSKKNIVNDTDSSNENIEFYTSVLEFIENYLDILNNSKFDDEL